MYFRRVFSLKDKEISKARVYISGIGYYEIRIDGKKVSDEVETYEPKFTYHGFRYVEVAGFPGVPTLESIEGRVVHTDVEKTGDFYCSNDLIKKIHNNILWAQLSNLMSIPTDCPQRDERLGWMGDAHLSAEEAIYNFDIWYWSCWI